MTTAVVDDSVICHERLEVMIPRWIQPFTEWFRKLLFQLEHFGSKSITMSCEAFRSWILP